MSKSQNIIIASLAFIAGVVLCTVTMSIIFMLSFNHYKTSYENALIEAERQEMRLAHEQ